ncbi:MAG TPA: peptidoglycan-associated lipoprotein Pal [Gemmatimonadaceae bacterium]|nr:peptidoglycan-associated lipoprotein Pal [Gemmatimonadaceae bacterium]
MIRYSRVAPVLLLAGMVTVGACRRPEPEVVPPAPAIDTAAERRAREAAAAAAEAERRRLEAEAAERARLEAERRRADSVAAENRRMESLRTTMASAVYFDFDRSELTSQARATLDQKVPILRANTNLRIRVAGHTDERGSDEYNMALGQRRAASARRYLVSQGIAEGRIDIVSYGEDRPAAMGSDESAWAQNRRAEFEIVSGGDRLVSPSQ